MKCNLCENDSFGDMGNRTHVRCTKCGSLERTRLLWLYLQQMALEQLSRILHIAPERGLYDAISKRVAPGRYVVADISPERYPFVAGCMKIDLCSIDDEPSNQYDLILHSHVLEHTPCNIAYTLYHLHRMLKPNGRHICVIPFMSGRYDESFQDLSRAERERRFGQFDHVRRFGRDDRSAHLGALIQLPESYDATQHFTPEVLRQANVPENHWRGFHIGTMLNLGKTDFKLR